MKHICLPFTHYQTGLRIKDKHRIYIINGAELLGHHLECAIVTFKRFLMACLSVAT